MCGRKEGQKEKKRKKKRLIFEGGKNKEVEEYERGDTREDREEV